MRLTTLAGIAAVAAAALAAMAAFYAPHPLIKYLRPAPHGIVTFGQAGGVSPEEAERMLSPYNSIFVGSVAGAWGSLGSPEGEEYDYTQTNVQVPGVDEGDILKLAPPYGLYISGGTLYLLRLWPPEEMGVLDKVNLKELAGSLVGGSKPIIQKRQVLVNNDTAIVLIDYVAHTTVLFPRCSGYQTLAISVGGENLEFRLPKCLPSSLAGVAVAVYVFGDGALRLVSNHTITGMRLVDSRMSGGVAYVFLAPYFGIALGNERVDGVGILEAGPTYVAGASSIANTLISVVALDPKTGEVGVTNVILPFEVSTHYMNVYMKGSEAYLLIKDSPDIPDEDYARLITSCAAKAPDDLRHELEALGPDPSPDDALAAIKDWVMGFAADAAPLIEWVHNLTKGILSPALMSSLATGARMPAQVNETIGVLTNKSKDITAFASCVTQAGKSLPGVATRIVKLGFTGVTGFLESSTKVNGRITERFAVGESGDYLFVVTTGERALVAQPVLPTQFLGFNFIQENGEYLTQQLIFTTLMFVYQINYLENTQELSDIFFIFEDYMHPLNTTLYILRTDDLTLVARLANIAPGERVHAARYVNGYLYLVTYRRTDPLYTIDVTDPAHPEIIGWLKLPGYSEYLHPWGDRYLIGVGVSGRHYLKVDIYDISDPANITRVSSVEAGGWSQALWDYHAFQPIDNRTFAIPIKYWSGKLREGIVLFGVSASGGLTNLGVIKVASPQRSARINDAIYAFGAKEVVAAQLPSLTIIKKLSLRAGTG